MQSSAWQYELSTEPPRRPAASAAGQAGRHACILGTSTQAGRLRPPRQGAPLRTSCNTTSTTHMAGPGGLARPSCSGTEAAASASRGQGRRVAGRARGVSVPRGRGKEAPAGRLHDSSWGRDQTQISAPASARRGHSAVILSVDRIWKREKGAGPPGALRTRAPLRMSPCKGRRDPCPGPAPASRPGVADAEGSGWRARGKGNAEHAWAPAEGGQRQAQPRPLSVGGWTGEQGRPGAPMANFCCWPPGPRPPLGPARAAGGIKPQGSLVRRGHAATTKPRSPEQRATAQRWRPWSAPPPAPSTAPAPRSAASPGCAGQGLDCF